MPILTLTVAEGLRDEVSRNSKEIADQLLSCIRQHLAPAIGTEQVMFVPAFGAGIGCDMLAHLVHRASESRTPEIRDACAHAICQLLAKKFDCSVRVRLIATDSAAIAAADIFKECGDE